MRDLAWYRGTPVPYIACWSAESNTALNSEGSQIELAVMDGQDHGRVSYSDESPYDRDTHGVLWQRYPMAPGKGEPMFARVHPMRQRRCMNRLLCQVCGNPADHDERGWLWLVTAKDANGLAAGEQDRVKTENPPVCQSCADLARKHCPRLMAGNALVRVAEVTPWGVYGILAPPPGSTSMESMSIGYGDPRIHMVVAGKQLVTLSGITVIE